VERSKRMRSADAAWLGIDRPENRLVVTAVLRLSGVLDIEDLRGRVQQRMVVHHPRLSSVARRRAVPLARPRWHRDPTFDVCRHVVDATPEHPCDDGTLQRLTDELFSQPIEPAGPPWQIHLVRRADGGSTLVARFHHSLADGMALASVLLRVTDQETAGTDPAADPGATHPPARRRAVRPARAFAAMVAVVARLLAILGEPPPLLQGPLGPAKSLALTWPHDLEDVRRVARAHGVSVNDVLLAAAAGGLREHLVQRGGPAVDLRVLVPVDLRAGAPVPADLGNRFGVVFVGLPVGERDPVRRLQAVAASTARLKASAEAGGTYLLLRVVGALPLFVRPALVALLEHGVSAVVTNVPGPRLPLTIGPTRVEDVAFWAPTVGRVGLGISLFSYAGTVTVGVAVDAALGIDAAELAHAIEDEIAVLAG